MDLWRATSRWVGLVGLVGGAGWYKPLPLLHEVMAAVLCGKQQPLLTLVVLAHFFLVHLFTYLPSAEE